MASIKENGTWELCDLHAGQHPIGLKWVYKLKKNPAGEVIHHKACLVAKGYAQRAGIDFDKVFAPVARLDSVHVLLAVVAASRLRHQRHGRQGAASEEGALRASSGTVGVERQAS
jgi:hypothetical protein